MTPDELPGSSTSSTAGHGRATSDRDARLRRPRRSGARPARPRLRGRTARRARAPRRLLARAVHPPQHDSARGGARGGRLDVCERRVPAPGARGVPADAGRRQERARAARRVRQRHRVGHSAAAISRSGLPRKVSSTPPSRSAASAISAAAAAAGLGSDAVAEFLGGSRTRCPTPTGEAARPHGSRSGAARCSCTAPTTIGCRSTMRGATRSAERRRRRLPPRRGRRRPLSRSTRAPRVADARRRVPTLSRVVVEAQADERPRRDPVRPDDARAARRARSTCSSWPAASSPSSTRPRSTSGSSPATRTCSRC